MLSIKIVTVLALWIVHVHGHMKIISPSSHQPIPGTLLTKQMDVLQQDLVKSQNSGLDCFNRPEISQAPRQ